MSLYYNLNNIIKMAEFGDIQHDLSPSSSSGNGVKDNTRSRMRSFLAKQGERITSRRGRGAIDTTASQREKEIDSPAETMNTPLEIIRNPHTTIIINNEAVDASWGQRLADVCQDGVPRDWTRPPGVRKDNIYMGEVDGRRFLAKRRYDTATSKTDLERIKDLSYGQRRKYRARNSLISEIRLAQLVRRLVASDDTQAVARDCGLSGIAYVEPIIGLIDRHINSQFAQKIMVYPYIDQAKQYWVPGGKPPNPAITDYLRAKFKEVGIMAADLSPIQLIVGPKGQAYLLDSEEYFMQKHHPNIATEIE